LRWDWKREEEGICERYPAVMMAWDSMEVVKLLMYIKRGSMETISVA
jgi:hypothetical protein